MRFKRILKNLLLATLFKKNIIKRLDSKNSVYLTFDDGPHKYNTIKILDILNRYNAKATFFLLGSEITKFPELTKKISDQGHSVGGHSWSHSKRGRLSFFHEISDIKANMEILFKTCKKKSILYRPPYGIVSLGLLFMSIFRSLKIILWSIDSLDDYSKSEVEIKKIFLDMNSGDIILLHEDCDATVRVLSDVLNEFQKRGLKANAIKDS